MKALKIIGVVVSVACILMGAVLFLATDDKLQAAFLFGFGTALLIVCLRLPNKLENRRESETSPRRAAQPEPIPTPAAAAPTAPVFKTKRMLRDERRAAAKAQGLASCPRCGSTSLSVNKKGFSAGQAYAGMLTAGGILLGTVGMNKLKVTCLNCGYRFKPGKGRQ